MAFREMTWTVWNYGDNSVGIPGAEATITINLDDTDTEVIEGFREEMVKSFSKFWDFKTYAMTDWENFCDLQLEIEAYEYEDRMNNLAEVM
jgi:hypothetical protein